MNIQSLIDGYFNYNPPHTHIHTTQLMEWKERRKEGRKEGRMGGREGGKKM